jgi:transposase
VEEIHELKRQGLSVRAIGEELGLDRKTVRKYLKQPAETPAYGPRRGIASQLDPHKDYLRERTSAGVWNAKVLLRELTDDRGYKGGYTILTDWLRPQRQTAAVAAVRRFETPPGHQAQVDWGHLGTLETNGEKRALSGFVYTLGYSRMLYAEAATDQKLATLLRLHERAFDAMDGVPEEVLYDRMKTVWQGTDRRGDIVWNPIFLDFAKYWGFQPRLCKPYRAQTKGKIESGVKYLRRNFLCGLLDREPSGLIDFNAQLRQWTHTVANERVHGTTHRRVKVLFDADQFSLQRLNGRLPYPYLDEETRKVARDAFVSWQGSRYSVPWIYAGKEVWVREKAGRLVEVRHGAERIAEHGMAPHRHLIVRDPDHHEGIPLNVSDQRKTVVHLHQHAPAVEVRSLAAYEAAALGGAQ